MENTAKQSEKNMLELPAKFFMGQKDMTEYQVPESVNKIGDWAFFGARKLTILKFPLKAISFGKDVFGKCQCLLSVYLFDIERGLVVNENTVRVLADALREFGDLSLWQYIATYGDGTNEFAKAQRKWLSAYDSKLLAYLNKPENDGFQVMWFGGEEDYDDSDTNVKAYVKKIREKRVRLIYNRLVEDTALEEKTRKVLQQWLRKYTPAHPDNIKEYNAAVEAALILKDICKENLNYVYAFISAGCVVYENAFELMQFFREMDAEPKAILMEAIDKCYKNKTVEDIFAL